VPGHKLAVIGASGFVGSALCERLWFENAHSFTPFIHDAGNAARLARLPIKLRPLDLLDAGQVSAALEGHTTVINCSRGSDALMIQGLGNLIKAAKRNRIQQFIHISSTAIYGDDPPPASADESCPAEPGANSYGIQKKRQDDMVFALHGSGLPCWIFCPGNISGAFSAVSLGLAQALRSGVMGLVDGGLTPCNLVHVDNLVEAMLTALRNGQGSGERYFVNELTPVTWKQYFDDLLALSNLQCEYMPVARESILGLFAKQPSAGVVEHFKIALSGEFRKGLMIMPVLQKLDAFAQQNFALLPRTVQQKARRHLQRPVVIRQEPVATGFSVQDVWVRAQIRRSFHSPQKAVQQLGFQPVLSYQRGLENIVRWLEFVFSDADAFTKATRHRCTPASA